LYFSKDNYPIAQNIINAILQKKDACLAGHSQIDKRYSDSYNSDEQFQLGNAYLFSRHPFSKPILAYEWYKKAAQNGNLDAQLTMGNALRSGLNGVSKNLIEARCWFEAAAAQGSPEALDFLGSMYEQGQGGLNADFAKAATYYRLAASKGVVTAQESLAEMLQFGKGITKDIIEACVWYRKAEEAGSESAHKALLSIEKDK